MPRGKFEPSTDYDPDSCLPPELLLKENETRGTEEENFGHICNGYSSIQGPKVFHSKLNVLKITYTWSKSHSSGFTLEFDFHHYNNNCVHICDDQLCLSDADSLCNGIFECTDRSDEHACFPISQTTGASQYTHLDLIRVLVIILSVVLMPGLFVIICVASPLRLRSRMWRRQRRGRDRLEHSQLRPNSQGSEVVYVPSSATSQDQLLEAQISQQVRERQVQLSPVQTDTMLDLPPHIPISKDGEEGYVHSQKQLVCKRNTQYLDQSWYIRPPPNKSVSDRESPPPYSASLENVDQPPTRIVRDSNGCPVMLRCYSMSSSVLSSNGHSPKELVSKTHSRTMSTTSTTGRSRTLSASIPYSEHGNKPPEYPDTLSSDVKQNSPTKDNYV